MTARINFAGPAKGDAERAFTLAEVCVASFVFGIMMTSLYGAFATGFSLIQVTRENLRADRECGLQECFLCSMLERMETIRLYRWDQVIDPSYIPQTFTNYYYPDGLSKGSGGVMYTGSVHIASVPAALGSSYTNNMRQVSVNIGWISGKQVRRRDMSTFVTQYGLQNYVYSPTNSP